MTVPLESPLSTLAGVGPRTAEQLERLGVRNVLQLLLHLPYRYEDRTRCTPLAEVRVGMRTLVQGRIVALQIQGRKRSLAVRIEDQGAALTLRFFHYHRSLQQLQSGELLRCYGEVRQGPSGLELAHPELERLTDLTNANLATCLTPVYPSVQGLPQKRLRSLTRAALQMLQAPAVKDIPEPLPQATLLAFDFPGFAEALTLLHDPPAATDIEILGNGTHPARRRLAYEELLVHQLIRRRARADLQAQTAPAMSGAVPLVQQFIAALGFELTAAQQRVAGEILQDLSRKTPMLRLLMGDVGAGKTVLAAIAALQAIAHGYQAVIMAPTELLAEQHYRTFSGWFLPLAVPVQCISGRRRSTRQCDSTDGITALPGLIVGTHALFQEAVSYAKLGLIVIDEQHRFGVQQRLALREKARHGELVPHQLVMSATPIPRTLAMALCADLDLSVLDELPPSRQPVRTVAVPDTRRPAVLQRIAERCRQGRQAYWVCTLIDLSEALQCQAATLVAEELAKALPDVRIGLIHGRLAGEDKDRVMEAFKSGQLGVLVATTVVEVGMDVPNASLMVIENAERLGLAQLHQLRGRIGRGAQQSDCVLLYQAPLSDQAHARLAVMRESNDGFKIAERDLAIRGPGEVLGLRQAGMPRLRIADLIRDADLLPHVTATAEQMSGATDSAHDEQLLRRWFGDTMKIEIT